MRPSLRSVVLLPCMAALLSCADRLPGDAVGPALQQARLTIASRWPTLSSGASASLAALSADIVAARVRLASSTGAVVFEQTFSFPVGRDSMAVSVDVPIRGAQQTFSLTLELVEASGAIVLSGTQSVVASAGSSRPVLVSLNYVGPGAGVRSVSVSPATGSIAAGASQLLVAVALDAAGRAVSDVAFRWSSSDPTIASVAPSVGSTTVATPTGRRGAVTFTASAPSGISGTAQLTYLPVPARLAVISGGEQTGGGSRVLPLPFVVELTGADALPIAGQLVRFQSLTPGGRVSPEVATTGADGRAIASLTPGSVPGRYAFMATSGALATPSISVTANSDPAPIVFLLPLSALPSQIVVGAAIPEIAAQLSDATGAPVRTAGVKCTLLAIVSPGSGTVSATAVSDVNGVVRLSLPPYQGSPGDATLTFGVEGVGVVGTATIKVVAKP